MVSHLKVGKIEKKKTKHDNTCDWAELGSWVALVVNNLPSSEGDIRDVTSIPGLGRFPGGEHGNPL